MQPEFNVAPHAAARCLPPATARRYRAGPLAALALLCSASAWLAGHGEARAADLVEVYQRALVNDPEYRAAGATNRAAQEATPQARAGLLPELTVTASSSGVEQKNRAPIFANQRTRINFNDSQAGIFMVQPLYRKDRWIALDQARTNVDAADATFEFARQSALLRAAERYFNVLRAEDTLTFARAENEAFRQQLEQSQQRFEVGLIAITDVEEAKAGDDLSRARVIQAVNGLDNAREALREVAGEYFEVLAGLVEDIPLQLPQPDDIDAWTGLALEQNLQLKSQLYAARTARLEIDRSEAGHLPTLDIVGSHQRAQSAGFGSAGGAAALSNTDRWDTRIGLELSVPIYLGGSVVSRTRESRHLHDRSLDELERIRRAVQRQTRDSFLGISSGISRVNALGQAVVSTQSAVEAIEAGFQVGTRTTVDVLNAQRDLFEARRNYADARYTYVVDILTLKQAAGSLNEEDLRIVNAWLKE